MTKMLWLIFIALLVAFMPMIPHDNEIREGVVIIEHRSIYEVLKERHEESQKRLGVVSPSVPKVQGEDVVSEGKHAQ